MSLDPNDLDEIERRVRVSLRTGRLDDLTLVGHGDVSLALGWPTNAPTRVIKRVPPFRSAPSAAGYVDACRRYFAHFESVGVAVWPTDLHTVARDDGRHVVYHEQPLADAATIGSEVLRAATPSATHPLVDAIVDAVGAVASPSFGIDAQASNWVWDGTTAHQLDFTSPFMLTPDGNDLVYDSSAFLQEFPLLVRGVVRKDLRGVLHRYTTPAGTLGDTLAMLLKANLDQWVEPMIESAQQRLGIHVSAADARRVLDEDLKIFPKVLRLKKAQRRWMRLTRRSYESLLPERSTYELSGSA